MSLCTPHFATLYTTSANDLFADFFVPALEEAVYYDRGVGDFSSGWLRLAAQGIAREVEINCSQGKFNSTVGKPQ